MEGNYEFEQAGTLSIKSLNFKPRTFMKYHFGLHNLLHVKY